MAAAAVRALQRSAERVSYRAWQLGRVTTSRGRSIAMRNARIESALVNVRPLAYFVTTKGHASYNADFRRYGNGIWISEAEAITPIAEAVIDAVSKYLAHAYLFKHEGASDDERERHPGAWPVPELAVVFTGALASFVDALNVSAEYGTRAAWFEPSLRRTHDRLVATNPLAPPTPVSENPIVGDLTTALQSFLSSQTILPPP